MWVNFRSARFLQKSAVKALNFGPIVNFELFFRKGLQSSKRVLQKKKIAGKTSYRKCLDLKIAKIRFL